MDCKSVEDIMATDIHKETGSSLHNLPAYTPGVTLLVLEAHVVQLDGQFRDVCILSRWQLEGGQQPAGGTHFMRQAISFLDGLDQFASALCRGGRQAEFAKDAFGVWARAWRIYREQFFDQHAANVQEQLPDKYQQLEDLIGRHEQHWNGFLG
jgi:hypothetical protein